MRNLILDRSIFYTNIGSASDLDISILSSVYKHSSEIVSFFFGRQILIRLNIGIFQYGTVSWINSVVQLVSVYSEWGTFFLHTRIKYPSREPDTFVISKLLSEMKYLGIDLTEGWKPFWAAKVWEKNNISSPVWEVIIIEEKGFRKNLIKSYVVSRITTPF